MKQFEKVMNFIESQYDTQAFNVGQKLPSIRHLAKQLTVNKGTVIRAYDALVAQHKAYVIPKSGYYWLSRVQEDSPSETCIDFTKLHPDTALLPYKEFEHCLNQAIQLYKRELFNYGTTQGLPSLVKALKEHLANRQVHTNEANIFITSGSQQALSLICDLSMHLDQTQSQQSVTAQGVIVEQPTYSVVQMLCRYKQIQMAGVPRNEQGLDFKTLESLFRTKQYRFFYTIPRCHNPLGTSLSEKDKIKLVALAHKYDIYIIEDDYVGDLITADKANPIHYYDTHERVIYVKSFSKAFLPGIRLGTVVLPKSLIEPFALFKRMHDLSTAVLSQGALEIYLTSGLYDKHTAKAAKWYAKKYQFLLPLLQQLESEHVHVVMPDSGFLSYMRFSKAFPFEQFLQRAKAQGLVINHTQSFYLEATDPANGIRLCYAALSNDEIKKGLTQLKNIFQQISPKT